MPNDPQLEKELARLRLQVKKRMFIIVGGALLAVIFAALVVATFFVTTVRYSRVRPPPLPTPSPSLKFPEFPWPPRSSAFSRIPNHYVTTLEGQTTLKDVGLRLEGAFRSGGYEQTGYYSVPGGFALVSRLEQFKSDGMPANESYRWSSDVQVPPFLSLEYWITLITGKVGRYRVIVFVITDDFFSQASGKKVGSEEAASLAINGANRLPDEIGSIPFQDDYTCTALVYEFEKRFADQPAEFKENGSLLAERHLQKILPHLQR